MNNKPSRKTRRSHNNERGFTMIEIVSVLLLVCIVGAVIIVSGVYTTSGYDLRSETEIIKSHLRYAQTRAINSNRVWGMKFFRSEDKSYYYLFQIDDSNNEVSIVLPGESSSPAELPEGMIVSVNNVYFDDWGRPFGVLPTPSSTSSTITITVDTEAIVITKNTGFIP